MATYKIIFNTNNACFEDNWEGSINRLFNDIRLKFVFDIFEDASFRDINGNTIARVERVKDE